MRVRTYSYAHVNGRPVSVSPVFVFALVLGIFVLIGGGFGIAGYFVKKSDADMKARCTVSVQADVIDMKRNEDGLETPVYSYVYEGETIRYSNNTYTNHPAYYKGDKAELMVNPDKPTEAYSEKDTSTAFLGTVFMIVGFGVIGLGVVMLLVCLFIVHLGKKQAEREKNEPWAQ